MKKILYSGMTLLLLAACKGQVTQTEEERSAVPDEAIVTQPQVCLRESGRRTFPQAGGCNRPQPAGLHSNHVDGAETAAQVVISKAFYLESMLADHGEED